MSDLYKSKHILVLNDRKLDNTKVNNFAGFNTQLLIKNFGRGQVIYFVDLIREKGIKYTEAQIMDTIRKNDISIVFFVPNGNNYELSIEFFKMLRDGLKVKTVLLVLDDELIFDVLTKYYAQVFNAAVTCDYYATFAYQKLNIPALYFFSNFSKKDFYPVNLDKDIDVSFVGDCAKADRKEYIAYLKTKGIKVLTYGKGSENGFVTMENLPKIFSRSKINLNFTKIDKVKPFAWFLEDNTLTNIIRQNKGRPMEVAMTGSFCLSEYSPALNVTFTIGKDVDMFYNKEDLYEKILFYLRNDALRIEMASNAYKKAVTLYEADIFMPRLVEKLCGILDNYICLINEQIIYKDSLFKKNHLIRLTTMMVLQLSKFRFRTAFETFLKLFQYGFGFFCICFCKGIKLSLFKAFDERT